MSQVTLAEVPEVLEPAFDAGDPDSKAKVPERENVALVSRMFGLIAEGRFDELRDCVTPDITLQMVAPDKLPWVRRAAGADEFAAAVAHNFGTVVDQRPEPLGLVAQGDMVMVMGHETGRLAETGEPYEVMLAHQFTFRDGRLAAFRSVAGEVPGGGYSA